MAPVSPKPFATLKRLRAKIMSPFYVTTALSITLV